MGCIVGGAIDHLECCRSIVVVLYYATAPGVRRDLLKCKQTIRVFLALLKLSIFRAALGFEVNGIARNSHVISANCLPWIMEKGGEWSILRGVKGKRAGKGKSRRSVPANKLREQI